jgi:hypothetical protein
MATIVALTVVGAALLLPNHSLLIGVLLSDSISFSSKINFTFSLLGSITTNFTLFSATYLILVAIMFGINIALLTFYIRRRQNKQSSKKMKLANAGGIISAVFGIGCMACGSIILTAIFGIFGAGALIAALPFHGIEFGVVGILLLAFSIYYIAKRTNDPLVCRVD